MTTNTARPWISHYEAGVPSTLVYPDQPLQHFLEQAARAHGDRVATVFFKGKLTYAQLNALADRFAAGLQSLGVKKGDRVAVLLPNSPQFIIAFYGALKAGATVVPTNPLYTADELARQVNDSGADTLICLSKFWSTVDAARKTMKARNIIVTNIKEYFPPLTKLLFTLAREKKDGHRADLPNDPGVRRWSAVMSAAPAQPEPVALNPSDLAVLQYTGGTTGVPKGAMLSHGNLVSNALMVKNWSLAREAQEIMLGVIPFFHVYGLTVGMNMSIASAATMVLLPRFDLVDVLRTIDKERPTFFPGVPTMYIAINNHKGVKDYDLRSVRACISGAAPLPLEVSKAFEALSGGKLVEGYGLSEASPVAASNPLNGERREGIGLPFPDTLMRLVDIESGERDVALGDPGEIIIQGPQVMQGYWQRPSDTASVIRNGWLYTGDIGTMDADGYFKIVDRKKDMIIASGFKIYPREVEEIVYAHPKVKEAVVVGIPDKYRGETVKLYVVVKDGETLTAEDLHAYCKEHLTNYKRPAMIEFRDSLPKTMIGKMLRRVLVEEERVKQRAQAGS
ncbi:MAG TPA: long-chain fatty acid--CoA ligase [Thermoflexales bacterium]|nr:long-chain fatty acid--CoA ligase [Thermoflexales bacterium]